MRHPTSSLLGPALVTLALSGCSRGADWQWTTPAVVDEDGLAELLRPRTDEKLVLANFWASW